MVSLMVAVLPTLACRPTESGVRASGGVQGVVARRVLSRDTVDYRVGVGSQEALVQESVRKPFLVEGEGCGLWFTRLQWYGG
jgi:hypothetical protein